MRRTVLSVAAAMACPAWRRAAPGGEGRPDRAAVRITCPARPGERMGAEMGIEHINAQGGVKALGGAKLKLVIIDCGDTTEKAKNAAQRMVAQETDLVAAPAPI